jgi:hypothetical protein
MKKVRGLLFASVLLCSAGGAQAFQLNANTPPTIHQLNPQPLPPGMQAQPQVSPSAHGNYAPNGKAPPNPCKSCAKVDYF